MVRLGAGPATVLLQTMAVAAMPRAEQNSEVALLVAQNRAEAVLVVCRSEPPVATAEVVARTGEPWVALTVQTRPGPVVEQARTPAK